MPGKCREAFFSLSQRRESVANHYSHLTNNLKSKIL
jgi:hypothetical protein